MYESFFGLTGPPFRLVPDPAFLFIGKGHRDAFEEAADVAGISRSDAREVIAEL